MHNSYYACHWNIISITYLSWYMCIYCIYIICHAHNTTMLHTYKIVLVGHRGIRVKRLLCVTAQIETYIFNSFSFMGADTSHIGATS